MKSAQRKQAREDIDGLRENLRRLATGSRSTMQHCPRVAGEAAVADRESMVSWQVLEEKCHNEKNLSIRDMVGFGLQARLDGGRTVPSIHSGNRVSDLAGMAVKKVV